MQNKIISSILGLALLGAAAQAQSTNIFNSLSDSVIGDGPIGQNVFAPPGMNGDNWRAQSFTTDDANWTVDAVTLSLDSGEDTTGGFTLSLYGDNDGTPGTLLGTLAGNDNPGAGLFSYTGAIDLNPYSVYWVVANVSSEFAGNMFWWKAADAGTSVGSTVGAGYSSGGASWFTDPSTSLLMEVDASPTPVPEPATMALAGLGGLSLLLFRRRK